MEYNLPYETLWGKREKFCFLNVCSHRGFKYILSHSVDGGDYSTRLRKGYNKIILFEKQLLDKKVPFEKNHLRSYFLPKLKYCPECIREGYHSIFHQYLFMERCFIDNQVLIETDIPFNNNLHSIEMHSNFMLENYVTVESIVKSTAMKGVIEKAYNQLNQTCDFLDVMDFNQSGSLLFQSTKQKIQEILFHSNTWNNGIYEIGRFERANL